MYGLSTLYWDYEMFMSVFRVISMKDSDPRERVIEIILEQLLIVISQKVVIV